MNYSQIILIACLILNFIWVCLSQADLSSQRTFELNKISMKELQSPSLRNLDHLIDLKGDSSPIFGNSTTINYYYVNLYIGEPPQKQSLIVDTGSHLTAVPCLPHCQKCGTHLNKYYDMRLSNKSKTVSCEEEVCKNLWVGSCGSESQCDFRIVIKLIIIVLSRAIQFIGNCR